MQIGSIEIEPALFFAPMAGYSDKPTRKICREYGAEIVYTEFVSSEGLIRNSSKTKNYLKFDESERPIGVQIFGHRAKAMAQAAAIVEDEFSPDLIDINMGCSVKKVVKKGAGSALLNDLDRALDITRKTVQAAEIPVTVKIRSGWNHENINYIKIGKKLETTGIEAITIHPRTASDGFGNTPNYEHIQKLQEAVSIPVIGNGNIDSVSKAQEVLDRTNCAGIMIGRWALGNPWLLKEINNYMQDQSYQEPSPTPRDKVKLCRQHLKAEKRYRGGQKANKIMKKYYKWYFKGFYNASNLRDKLVHTEKIEETQEILDNFQNNLNLNNE